MENNYRNIGKIVSGFGLKGDMILMHNLGKSIVVTKIKVIFVELTRGELLPYFIEHIRKKGEDELYLKLEGINSRESALRFIRKEVWLKEEENPGTYPEKQSHWLGRIPGDRPGKRSGTHCRNY